MGKWKNVTDPKEYSGTGLPPHVNTTQDPPKQQLREQIDKLLIEHAYPVTYDLFDVPEQLTALFTTHSKAILQQLLDELPEKMKKSTFKPFSDDKLLQPEYTNERIWGYNYALREITEIIKGLMGGHDPLTYYTQKAADDFTKAKEDL